MKEILLKTNQLRNSNKQAEKKEFNDLVKKRRDYEKENSVVGYIVKFRMFLQKDNETGKDKFPIQTVKMLMGDFDRWIVSHKVMGRKLVSLDPIISPVELKRQADEKADEAKAAEDAKKGDN